MEPWGLPSTPVSPRGLLFPEMAEDVLSSGSDTLCYPRHSRRYRIELAGGGNPGHHSHHKPSGDQTDTTVSVSLERWLNQWSTGYSNL